MKDEKNNDVEVISATVSKNGVEYVQKNGKRSKQEIQARDIKPGNYGPDYERRRAEVNREANRKIIKPISHEIFQKTKDEKEQLKALKSIHKSAIKKQGLDPKKTMNPSGNLYN